ncbi:hypothetical protein [Motilibacter aurantiacus]|uniref:hypothetical protein n=1 Tax=Motilibacter aurantiacus TaxID=2714955 RepID=UPI00140C4985|nr:hypothetical protein [Motilibacter aurantiacus]NHC47169.1 hypothetical protein [Motilibacter aurantiacus]
MAANSTGASSSGALLGRGWWSLAAPLVGAVPDDVLAVWEQVGQALLLVPLGDGRWELLVRDGAGGREVLDDADARRAVGGWVAEHSAGLPRPRAVRVPKAPLPDGAPLSDPAAMLLREAGMPLHTGLPDSRALGGRGAGGGWNAPAYAGDLLVAPAVHPWVLGVMKDGERLGLWDRDTPQAPIQVWSSFRDPAAPTPEQFTAEQLAPLIEAVRLDGHLAYRRVGTGELEHAELLHWSPLGHATVFYDAWKGPGTGDRTRRGLTVVHSAMAQELGLDVAPGTWVEVELTDWATAKAVVSARPDGRWEDAPSGAPRGLRAALVWARERLGTPAPAPPSRMSAEEQACLQEEMQETLRRVRREVRAMQKAEREARAAAWSGSRPQVTAAPEPAVTGSPVDLVAVWVGGGAAEGEHAVEVLESVAGDGAEIVVDGKWRLVNLALEPAAYALAQPVLAAGAHAWHLSYHPDMHAAQVQLAAAGEVTATVIFSAPGSPLLRAGMRDILWSEQDVAATVAWAASLGRALTADYARALLAPATGLDAEPLRAALTLLDNIGAAGTSALNS